MLLYSGCKRQSSLALVITASLYLGLEVSTSAAEIKQSTELLSQFPYGIASPINDRNIQKNRVPSPSSVDPNQSQQDIERQRKIEYEAALQGLSQVLISYQKQGDRVREASTLENIGAIHEQLNQSVQAMQVYQQALLIRRELGDRKGEASILANIGAVQGQMGNYAQALQTYQQVLQIRRAMSDRSGEGSVLNSIGGIYYQQGNLQSALQIYQQSLKIRREIQDRPGEGRTLSNLGAAYDALGQYPQALGYYQQALAIFQMLNNQRGVGATLNNIGLVHASLGQYDRALTVYQQVLTIRREVGDRVGEGTTLHNIGFAYNQLKQNNKAVEIYQQALKLRREISDRPGEAATLNNLGYVYTQIGKSQQALEPLQQALAFFQEQGNRSGAGNTLDSLGTAYKELGQYSQALNAYQQALGILGEVGDRPGERTILSNIGALLEKQKKSEVAIVFYKEAVNVTESIRQNIRTLTIAEQKSYTETIASTYRSLANLLLAQGRILEAQQVLELLKIQEIQNFTQDTRAGEKSTSIATNLTETQILKTHGTLIAFGQKVEQCQETKCAQLNQLLDQRDTITEDFNQTVRQLEKDLRSRSTTDVASTNTDSLVRKANEIVAAQPGTLLIYPLVLPDKLWVLWVSKGGITKSIEVPDVKLAQISETVLKFRQLLQNRDSNIIEVKRTAKQLYDWLIPAALQAELKANNIQNLVFSLDHVTRYIPTAALFDGEKYLVERYSLSTILSADLTDSSDRLAAKAVSNPVLALGLSNSVPSFNNSVPSFNSLPNVPVELNAIVRQSATDTQGLYPGLKLLNGEFDYAALRNNLTGHRILHIATHGKFEPGSADASYLVLGNGEKLPITQIEKLRDLGKVHLVVLSACETALGGTGRDGTELAGMSYYFLKGGAKAVMASLWSVNDASTSVLMQQFYANLATGAERSPMTKAEALRRSQLYLIRGNQAVDGNSDRGQIVLTVLPGAKQAGDAGFAHPYYWAPFILIGNGL